MGLHGLIGSLGMAFGPALGSWIVQEFNMNTLFYASSGLSLLSILILVNMKETLEASQKEKFKFSLLKINRYDIYDSSVKPVVIVIFFTSFAYGTVVTLIPDLSKSIGVANKGYFFLVYTLASIAIRFLAGKWSDKNGRVQVLVLGCWILVIGMIITAYTTNLTTLTISAIFFGVSMGILSPICQAWTIDLCEEKSRGKAIATMYIALEFGIGIGAFLPTLVYQNQIKNLPLTFLFSTCFVAIALIYLIFYKRKNNISFIK